MSVWQSEIFCTQNTIKTRHVNGKVKKRQAAFELEILNFSSHISVIRGE